MNRSSQLAAVLLWSTALVGGVTAADVPGGPSAPGTPRKVYVNKMSFHLPATLTNVDVSKLEELKLYVKVGGGEWVAKSSTAPSQPSFNCSVSQDGEYWFSIVAVDRNGSMLTPPAGQSASMLVVVDTTPPEVDARPLSGSGRRGLVECIVHDANPDYHGIKVEYQGPNNTWQPLSAVSDKPGIFQMADEQPLPHLVRVTAADRAGNTTVKTFTFNAATETAAVPTPVEPRGEQLPLLPATEVPVQPVAYTTSDKPGDKNAERSLEPSAPPPLRLVPGEPTPIREPILGSEPMPFHTAVVPETAPLYTSPAAPEPMSLRMGTNGPERKLVNRTHITLKYQLEQVGPSGISKLEVWGTTDRGQTWQYLCDDPGCRSGRPSSVRLVEVDLPGDGLIGLKLVVRNGIGFGGTAPARGDVPDWWVEVDTTTPFVQLQEIMPLSGSTVPSVLVTWVARDKNFGEEPIQLWYAATAEGPWQPIGPRLKNTGKYRWVLPSAVGSQFFVKLVATDEAGNFTQCQTSEAVVIDQSQPKVRVLGLETEPRPAPPSAN